MVNVSLITTFKNPQDFLEGIEGMLGTGLNIHGGWSSTLRRAGEFGNCSYRVADVRHGEPQREHDGQQEQVGGLLASGVRPF